MTLKSLALIVERNELRKHRTRVSNRYLCASGHEIPILKMMNCNLHVILSKNSFEEFVDSKEANHRNDKWINS